LWATLAVLVAVAGAAPLDFELFPSQEKSRTTSPMPTIIFAVMPAESMSWVSVGFILAALS
jgi:hypothetical protein